MIKFKSLLKENPDTVYYKGKSYNYTSPSNRCAFFVYEDAISGKKSLFAYSDNKKDFYSDDPKVLSDVKELSDGEQIAYPPSGDFKDESIQNMYWAQKSFKRLKNRKDGGGHLELEDILKGLKRFKDIVLKGRIFEVDDSVEVDDSDLKIESTIPNGKAIIVTFWTYKKIKVVPYKSQYEKVIEFNGYDPKECLYELGDEDFITYNELYDSSGTNEKPKENPIEKPIAEPIKVGDTVTFSQYDSTLRAKVVEIDGLIVILKTTVPGDGMKVGDEFKFALPLVKKVKEEGDDIQTMYDDKMDAFVTKSGELHTTGARITPQEKENLQREVDKLQFETKKLKMYIDAGIKVLTPQRKTELETFVNHELAKKHAEKKDAYSLVKQAEKQFGMPIAQIRQKFRGVPLDQLVKKESIYKKLLRLLK